jgi:hypothetical protein
MIIWRSLVYIYHIEIYNLIFLPSKISILGYFQEDIEKYHGIYIIENISMDIIMDMTEDMIDMMDISEDMMEDI